MSSYPRTPHKNDKKVRNGSTSLETQGLGPTPNLIGLGVSDKKLSYHLIDLSGGKQRLAATIDLHTGGDLTKRFYFRLSKFSSRIETKMPEARDIASIFFLPNGGTDALQRTETRTGWGSQTFGRTNENRGGAN